MTANQIDMNPFKFNGGKIMRYYDDPCFDKKMKDLSDFLTDQQVRLTALFDEGPDEHSPEAIF